MTEIQRKMKNVAIYSGGSWSDASCDLIEIDSNIDIDKKHKEYSKWYNYVYIPAYKEGEKPKFYNFVEWLKHFCGAKDAENIETFWE